VGFLCEEPCGKFGEDSGGVQLIGVLRLRGCFALRSIHFAQDDKGYWLPVLGAQVFFFLLALGPCAYPATDDRIPNKLSPLVILRLRGCFAQDDKG